jgi:hypothetical protein
MEKKSDAKERLLDRLRIYETKLKFLRRVKQLIGQNDIHLNDSIDSLKEYRAYVERLNNFKEWSKRKLATDLRDTSEEGEEAVLLALAVHSVYSTRSRSADVFWRVGGRD